MESPENLSASLLQRTQINPRRKLMALSYILANRLNVGYAKEVIVPDISFRFKTRNKPLALIGTNGSGKSTLLNYRRAAATMGDNSRYLGAYLEVITGVLPISVSFTLQVSFYRSG